MFLLNESLLLSCLQKRGHFVSRPMMENTNRYINCAIEMWDKLESNCVIGRQLGRASYSVELFGEKAF